MDNRGTIDVMKHISRSFNDKSGMYEILEVIFGIAFTKGEDK